MSATGIVSLLQSLSNQNTTAGQDSAPAPKAASTQPAQASPATAQDEFTPSAQNATSQFTAQAAGLFSVAGTPLFSTAANSLLAQNNATPAQAAATAASGSVAKLVSAQEHLQSLNLALAALGLSNQQIDQLDQVAGATSNYNPSAYTAQAYELEILARQPAPQVLAPTPATPPALAQANATAAKAAAAGNTAAKT